MMQKLELERCSSAITLSDMEIFIFPELMLSLVLANIMSPCIWRWRDDPWFDGIDAMPPYKRLMRVKQYIMDHYAFNLDLDTWGLTQTETELKRFESIIDRATLEQSNALFGYTGDKYYFDIDIRTHFGLDKYDGNVIPYWKTETVEAMDAFCYRPGYKHGAGECVSLAALYAAALFVIARIPLEDIYLMATPLHSQNFVMVSEGVLTNNRRLVTKNMWFNGTALSAQARRALENERVTLVAHLSGFIHAIYPQTTIDKEAYARFSHALSDYLRTSLTCEILGNFIRQERDMQKCFQLRWERNGTDMFVPLEKAFDYENGSPFRITDNTRAKLMEDVDNEDFVCRPLPRRIVLNDLETFIQERKPDIDDEADRLALEQQFDCDCLNANLAIKTLIRFCHVHPQLPKEDEKTFTVSASPLALTLDQTREDVITMLLERRDDHEAARLAFYAYRDLLHIPYEPYLKACIERNPVCVEGSADLSMDALLETCDSMPSESIYEGDGRLAQPDEVWNYGRGDGLEKAVMIATILHARAPSALTLNVTETSVTLESDGKVYTFSTGKRVPPSVWHYPFETL